MSGFIASVDARTQLAGRNRMELLLFRLAGVQRFGINVFKVREVIQCPPLTNVPQTHHVIRGIINIRGTTMSVMDLGVAMGMPPIEDPSKCFLVITEYNKQVQGFLVGAVDRIVNHNWQEILAPPKGSVSKGYLTAVTHVDGEIVEILDVERVLAEVMGVKTEVSEEILESRNAAGEEKNLILIADDSVVARNQIKKTAEQIGCETILVNDGLEAYELLTGWLENNSPEMERLGLIVSDVEMPNMDGYTLTTRIREHEKLRDYRVLLHTSLSGGFNEAMIKKVGADQFIAKFDPNDLATKIHEHLSLVQQGVSRLSAA